MKTKPAGAHSMARKSPVKLDEVAREAGVSPATVSRILNGTATVSALKTLAVESAIRKLGFTPNPVARGLAGGRTMSIGVITQAIDSPFYGAALRGIEDRLDPIGYCPLFVSGHWDAVAESRGVELLLARRVDGIIVLTGRLTDQALRACARRVPVVVTGRDMKAPGLYSLNFDNFEGGRLATQHLLDLGHREIAFVAGDGQHPDANERLRGHMHALKSAGVAANAALIVPGAYNELSGSLAVDKLLTSGIRFTAIFAANDQMALGAMLGLQRRAVRVPDDVSVVGYDDLPNAPYSNPPLSTIHQPAYELGELAAASMLQLVNGERPQGTLPAPRFVARESARRVGR